MKVYGELEVAQLEGFTDAGKPAASAYPHRIIWLTDLKRALVSDGTNWLPAQYFDGGTASDSQRLTLSKDTKANLDALTRKEGTLFYATDLDKVYYDDGSVLRVVGAGEASPDSAGEIANLALTASAASNILTIALKTKAGSNASGSDIVKIGFRSTTLTSGVYNQRTVTAALSLDVDASASLGLVASQDQFVWVYAIDNAGTVELAVSGSRLFDEGRIHSTTALSSGATNAFVLYSETARTNIAVRLIGRLLVNTATFWASSPTEVATFSSTTQLQNRSYIRMHGYTGYGAINTTVVRFTTVTSFNTSFYLDQLQNSNNGDYIEIKRDGVYSYRLEIRSSSPGNSVMVSKDSTSYPTHSTDACLADTCMSDGGERTTVSGTQWFPAGTKLRVHATGTLDILQFRVERVSD